MTLRWTQSPTPAVHDYHHHTSLHAPDVPNFTQRTAAAHNDYHQPAQPSSWVYGSQSPGGGAGYAINPNCGAALAYRTNTLQYNEHGPGDMSRAGNYGAHYPEVKTTPESLHLMSLSGSPHNVTTPLVGPDQVDRNLFTSPRAQHMPNAYYGNNIDGFIDADTPAEECWELSNQYRSPGHNINSSYFSHQNEFSLATPFADSYALSAGPTNDHPYSSTRPISQLHRIGRMAAERMPQPRVDISPQSLAPQDAFYASYENHKGTLPAAHPTTTTTTTFTPAQQQHQFTDQHHDHDQRQCSPHPLSLGPSAYPALPALSQHQPVPINHHSSYSELSANLAYISQTTPPKSQHPLHPHPPHRNTRAPAPKTPQNLRGAPPEAAPSRHHGHSSRRTHQPQEILRLLPLDELPRTTSAPTASGPHGHGETAPKAKKSTEKKQTLACLFCRERKIACGRPAEGSDDHTCNQCARRSFTCEYPTESRRGQHKRSRRKPHDGSDGN